MTTRPVLLLTGAPGVGKSTIIQRVIAQLPERPGGFFTREVRRHGMRVGFEIVTLDGETAILATTDAHATFPNQRRLGRFIVNVEAVAQVAVPAMERAAQRGALAAHQPETAEPHRDSCSCSSARAQAPHAALVIVDEIGPMEIFSERFCDAVRNLLDDATCAVLGTIVGRPYRFADDVKKHPRVRLVNVTRENREQLPTQLLAMLRLGVSRGAGQCAAGS
jgi:nucleoside-triphosphatase